MANQNIYLTMTMQTVVQWLKKSYHINLSCNISLSYGAPSKAHPSSVMIKKNILAGSTGFVSLLPKLVMLSTQHECPQYISAVVHTKYS